MSLYRVTLTKVLDCPVEVEASSAEEAAEKAVETEAAGTRLCHQCESHANDGEWDARVENVVLITEAGRA